VATVALIAAAASDQPSDAPRAAAAGFLIGALAGAVGGAVAGAVVRGRERRSSEDLRMQLHLQRQRDEQAFEERLQRLEASRLSSAKPERVDPRDSRFSRDLRQHDLKVADEPRVKPGSNELSPRVREFSAE
jgi:hypothetical protein